MHVHTPMHKSLCSGQGRAEICEVFHVCFQILRWYERAGEISTQQVLHDTRIWSGPRGERAHRPVAMWMDENESWGQEEKSVDQSQEGYCIYGSGYQRGALTSSKVTWWSHDLCLWSQFSTPSLSSLYSACWNLSTSCSPELIHRPGG